MVFFKNKIKYITIVVLPAVFIGFFAILIANLSNTWLALCIFSSIFTAAFSILIFMGKDASFSFLCLFIFSIPIDISKALFLRYPGSPIRLDMAFSDLCAYFMILSLFVDIFITKKKKVIVFNKIYLWYIFFIFWCILSVFVNGNFRTGFCVTYVHIKFFVMSLAIVNILYEKERLKQVVLVLMLAVFCQFSYSVLERFLGEFIKLQGQKITTMGRELFFGGSKVQMSRSAGTFHHPNVFASYMVYVLPIFFALLMKIKKNLYTLLLLLSFSAGCFCIIISYSRGGWLGLFMACVLAILLGFKRNIISFKIIMSMIGVGLIVTIMMFPVWKGVLNRLTKPDDKATIVRVLMIQQAYLMLINNPIVGVGAGNYFRSSQKTKYLPADAINLGYMMRKDLAIGNIVHNKYMHIAGSTGLVGIIVLLIIFFKLAQYAYISSNYIKDKFVQYVNIALFGALIGGCINMLFDHFYDNARNTIFWFIASLIIYIHSYYKREKGEVRSEN